MKPFNCLLCVLVNSMYMYVLVQDMYSCCKLLDICPWYTYYKPAPSLRAVDVLLYHT